MKARTKHLLGYALAYTLLVLGAALVIFSATGCTEGKSRHINGMGSSFQGFTHEGHDYISRPRGGIIHSESCPCK